MAALISRWYVFGPWILVVGLIWRQFGWRRALPIALGGWLVAFGAEWASTSGPGVPFGVYAYRNGGLAQDWRLLGVPLFDSLSFTWLAFCTYTVAGWLGARGARRLFLGALAMVAIDVVVDPVALRGAQWWLGSIYSYPAHAGVWYGVSWLNYVGWLVVGLALQLWLGFWLGGQRPGRRPTPVVAVLLLAGVMVQSSVLAIVLGIAPSAVPAVVLLAGLAFAARGFRAPASESDQPLVVVACALSSEAAAVRRALGPGWAARPVAEHVTWSRRLEPAVEVWETGMGPAAATAAARLAPGGAAILVAGVGGGCSEDWPLGSVGIGSRVLAEDSSWLDLDTAARAQLISAHAGREVQLGSRSVPVERMAERAELAAQGVGIVEMESAAWLSGRPSSVTGPVAALRVVVDTPAEPLGPAAELVAQGASAPSPTRVGRLILTRPGSVRRLIRVGRSQRLALDSLGLSVAIAVPLLVRTAQGRAELSLGGPTDDRTAVPAS
ncbi:MAG: carotenoid biosynthesis protein [Candidatus Dormiibacterota bacterium]